MIKNFIHPDDALITRTETAVVLRDSDGEERFELPKEWTDEHVRTALKLANYAYSLGYDSGESAKAREIRQALNID